VGTLRRALRGLEVMDASLDDVASALRDGRVPPAWLARSYPSLKPLGSYVTDLAGRLAFFHEWLERGPPDSFWLSGFFFTQAFLTGVLQNHARQLRIPIDRLHFAFHCLGTGAADAGDAGDAGTGVGVETGARAGLRSAAAATVPAAAASHASTAAAAAAEGVPREGVSRGGMARGGVRTEGAQPSQRLPREGVHVYGLFLEGGRFSHEHNLLAESLPGQLSAPLPLLWLRPSFHNHPDDPATGQGDAQAATLQYETPLYRTGERRGTLSTTGHSTNFVMFLKLPTAVPAEHWVKRGLAALCQLDD